MSIVASEMTPADIAAVTNNGGNNGGFGDGNGWWIILLFLFALGGWGNNGFGGGNGNGGGGVGSMIPYYFNNTDNNVNRGFADAALSGQLSNIQQSLANGFSDAEVAACNRAMNIMQTDYTNQIASMNQRFSDVQAVTGAINGVSSQLAQCCCDNRLATESLRATILQENCADRYEAANNTRDIIENANRNNQSILDKLCQLELDAKNQKISDLERQLTMSNLAASQTAQTAQLMADNARQTVALEQYLNPTPIPAYVVQNPNCCYNPCNQGCGCGNGNF